MINSNNFRKLIGENVRYFRRKGNLSQEELAIQAKLSTNFISRVERGLDNISTDSLHRIAQVLNIEPYLFLVSELHRSKVMAEREKE